MFSTAITATHVAIKSLHKQLYNLRRFPHADGTKLHKRLLMTTTLSCQTIRTPFPVFQRHNELLSSNTIRSFSYMQNFKPKAPESISSEVAEGILESTQFYCRFGVSGQRFKALAEIPDLPIIERWQEMMEIYVTTQIHVIAGLGYEASAEGLNMYAHHLAAGIQTTDATMRELFADIRRDTWREIVGTVFQINPIDIPVLTIIEARELMHKVSSKMMDADILLNIQNRTANIRDDNQDMELQMKHKVLQQILVEDVYLGGSPSLTEEAGFGTGGIGYAKIQCALSDHEGDPLMASYASTAMVKIFEAAGVEIDNIQGPGISCNPA